MATATKNYRVTIAPLEEPRFDEEGRRLPPRWTATYEVEGNSKNAARKSAMKKARKYLKDREIRIAGVEEIDGS